MSYTKKPWIYNDTYGLIEADGVEIAALHSGIKANANLIAAAPNLYEALEALNIFLCQNVDPEVIRKAPKAHMDALQALAKAQGSKGWV